MGALINDILHIRRVSYRGIVLLTMAITAASALLSFREIPQRIVISCDVTRLRIRAFKANVHTSRCLYIVTRMVRSNIFVFRTTAMIYLTRILSLPYLMCFLHRNIVRIAVGRGGVLIVRSHLAGFYNCMLLDALKLHRSGSLL